MSVRALHHYDSIRLLSPCGRTAAGYRLYSETDLLRLQQILIGRELGLSLEAIRRSLDDPKFGRRRALREQRGQLLRRAEHVAEMIRAIKEEASAIYRDAYAALQSGKRPGDPEDMDIAERHRFSIDRSFYPCSVKMHCGLAGLYERDKRFAEAIDQAGPGLTPFLSAAIRANALRAKAG